MMTFFRCVPVFFVCLVLSGCGTSTHVPVEELGQGYRTSLKARQAAPGTHIVVKGDTLFSIALRHDLDYRRLAQANNIPPPYVIRPNDVIYLRESAVRPSAPTSRSSGYPPKNPVVEPSSKNSGVAGGKGVKEKQPSAMLPTVNVDGSSASKQPETRKARVALPVGADVDGWLWPVDGKIVRQFSPGDDLSKGIDIGGVEGAPVLAARQGEVVYAGSGLKGYGNLIIIRHDDTFISAYAHNRAMLVKEGQVVRQGEAIAELGMTGTQTPKLHFEIRENGKPINPLLKLPAKK